MLSQLIEELNGFLKMDADIEVRFATRLITDEMRKFTKDSTRFVSQGKVEFCLAHFRRGAFLNPIREVGNLR